MKKVNYYMAKKRRKIPFILIAVVLLVMASLVAFLTSRREKQRSFACADGGNISEFYDSAAEFGVFEGKEVAIPKIAFDASKQKNVLGSSTEDRWIEINLTEQKLKAWDGGTLFLETLVSTGLPWWPTPQGEFKIWGKYRAVKMEGGSGKYYYYLPNVPYVMFFENSQVPSYRGFSLHGTYWHNDFGRVHSHGCVNLPTPIAEKLFYWTGPTLPDGKTLVRATADNPGTRIIIHE